MKVWACIIVSTGAAPFLPFVIGGAYKHVDKIVVVEGCDEWWARIGAAHPDGRALDHSGDVARMLPDPEKKIKVLGPTVFPHKNAQRDAYLNVVPEGDLVFLLDSDEFYTDVDWQTIIGVFRQQEDLLFPWDF